MTKIRGIPLAHWHELGHAWTHQPKLTRRQIARDLGMPDSQVDHVLRRRLGYDKRATQDRIMAGIGDAMRRGQIASLEEAAAKVGLSSWGVREALHRLGLRHCIPQRHRGPARKVDPAEALRMAREDGMRICDIARHFKVTPEAVCGALRRHTDYYEARDAAQHDRPVPPEERRARMLADGMKPRLIESILAAEVAE